MKTKKLNGLLSVRIIMVLIVLFMALNYTCYAYAADEDSNLIDICEILTRSNMRSTPSQDGRWVATIPEGAYVIVIEEGSGGFTLVEYGTYEGYVYSGCISGASPRSVEDYTQQFQNYIPTRNLANRSYSIQSSDSAAGHGGRMSFGDRTIGFEETIGLNSNAGDAEADQEPDEAAVSENSVSDDRGASQTTTNGNGNTMPSLDDYSNYNWQHIGSGGRRRSSSESSSYTAKATVLADVRLRSLPTVDSAKLSTVPINTEVYVIDEGENGFTHVKVDGQEGYIYSRCLDLSGVDFDRISGIVDLVVTNNSSDTNTSIAVARNRILTSNVLVLTGVPMNVRPTDNNEVEVQNVVEVASNKNDDMAHEIRTSVNMRSLPNSESEWLATIPTGSDVSIIDQGGDGYTLVQYNGIRGYVLDSCIGDVVDNIDIAKLGANPVLFDVTAYCSCRICCGSYSPEVRGGEAHTATGTIPVQGRTVAVDPSVIPYGTHIVVEGYGEYIAEDCGGKITGNHIDIYFESHEDAKAFGSRRLYVSVTR